MEPKVRIHGTLFYLFVMALGAPASAQPLPTASPESVGMSSERLERIGEVLRRDIEQDRMPGAVVAIARKGKLVFYESFGFLDKAAGTPMPKDAIFASASMTKPIVAVGALVLYEQGRHDPGRESGPTGETATQGSGDGCATSGA